MSEIDVEALKTDIREVTITRKANASPMVVRLAWHAAGTYDKKDGSGGSNGAGMRFAPESTDGANAGLSIVRDMLKPVEAKNPNVSIADIWTLAGAAAIESMGGPRIPHSFGRVDFKDGARCPMNGRLPDASKGAEHVREVFGRMGFNDQEMVALSGAHTLGRCHVTRSGYDGPWTRNPLKFDNAFFKNLLHLEWQPRKWSGPLQYEDVETGDLMMLPTDMALKTDPEFRKYVELYAKDEQAFFRDFAAAFSKLLALGAPQKTDRPSPKERAGLEFREAAMHGSLEHMKKHAAQCDAKEKEKSSGRTALHKAAFWGHDNVVEYLIKECKVDIDVQDYNGDTPLHDASRFGHVKVVDLLLKANVKGHIKNSAGLDAGGVAAQYKQDAIAKMLHKACPSLKKSKL